MSSSYRIPKRENPFQFHATEFLGDFPTVEDVYEVEAPVGALAYVINTGYCYIQARPGDWKQLKMGKGSTGRTGDRGPAGRDGRPGKDGEPGAPGKPGRDGQPGGRGLQGLPGTPGKDGSNGRDGQPGKPGLPGKDGRDGRDGKDGLPGQQGPRGFTGTNGEDGRGWIGGKYDHVSGRVTFTSEDGLTFKTDDLRGAPSPFADYTLEQLAHALKPYL